MTTAATSISGTTAHRAPNVGGISSCKHGLNNGEYGRVANVDALASLPSEASREAMGFRGQGENLTEVAAQTVRMPFLPPCQELAAAVRAHVDYRAGTVDRKVSILSSMAHGHSQTTFGQHTGTQ